MKLLYRLLLAICIPLCAAFASVWLIDEYYTLPAVREHLNEDALCALEKYSGSIDAYFAGNLNIVRSIAATPTVVRGDTKQVLKYLSAEERRLFPAVENLYYNDASGMAYGAGGSVVDTSKRYYFPVVKRGDSVVTRILSSLDTGRPIVYVLVPVFDHSGKRTAAVGASLNMEGVSSIVAGMKFNGFAMLVDEAGNAICPFLSDGKKSGLFGPISGSSKDGEISGLIAEVRKDISSPRQIKVRGKEYIAYCRHIEESGWKLAMFYNEDDYLEIISRFYRMLAMIFLGIFLAVMFFILLVKKTTISQISQLIEAHRKISKGDFTARAEVLSGDEIGELSKSFNQMAAQLQSHQGESQKAEKSLREAQRIARLGSYEWYPQIGEATASDEVWRIFDTPPRAQPFAYDLASSEFLHPEDREYVLTQFAQVTAAKSPVNDFEYRIKLHSGEVKNIHSHSEIEYDENGAPCRVCGIVQDVTAQKALESERLDNLYILQGIERVNRILQSSPDSEQVLKTVMDEVLDIFGCDRAGLIYPCDRSTDVFDVPVESTTPDYPGAKAEGAILRMDGVIITLIEEALANDGPHVYPSISVPFNDPVIKKYGTKSMIDMALHPKVGKSWMFALHQCSYERVWTEVEKKLFYEIGLRIADSLNTMLVVKNLRENEENLRITLDSIGDAVIATDAGGRVVRMNPVASKLTGWSMRHASGKPLCEVMQLADSDSGKRFKTSFPDGINGNGKLPPQVTLIARDGTECLISISGSPILNVKDEVVGAVLVFRDVTERLKMEEQLRQSQKMESIGQLAGGVAHDFNNMLGGIVGAAEIVSMRTDESDKNRKFINMILDTAERAAELIDKLLAFSRKGKLLSSTIDVHALLLDAMEILEHSIDKRINVSYLLDANKQTVIGDPSQIQGAFLNLGLNARDAMPEGGRLTVSTDNVELDRAYCDESHFDIVPGDYIRISVMDTGAGIDPKNISRIFEPFFTTKPVGKGTGLGLAAVYGTVRDHHGELTVKSEPGSGAEFCIFLPLTDAQRAIDVRRKDDFARGEGCILVIDDEGVIRTTATHLLEDLGYKVILASDGEDGIEVYRKYQGEIDLVILDMVMPRMSGRDCFYALKDFDPEARIVMSSGFARDESISDLREDGALGFIKKPYRRAELSELLASLIGN